MINLGQAPMPAKPTIRAALGIELPCVEVYDIGAMSEGTDRYLSLLKQQLANVTGFEPDSAEFAKLEAKKEARKRYYPYFIGKGGPGVFHIAHYPGCSSLYEADPGMIDLFAYMGATLGDGNFTVLRKEAVETRRLDDVPGLPPCDFMKIDVQGAELDVLKGASTALAHCAVLEVEVEFVPLYKNQPLFGDIQSFLRMHNFTLHKLVDISGRAFRPYELYKKPFQPISQALWADAIFVRNFADMNVWTSEQLLKAAMILYEAYWSYDLARYLLQKYDERSHTTLAEQFARALASMPELPLMFMNTKTNV